MCITRMQVVTALPILKILPSQNTAHWAKVLNKKVCTKPSKLSTAAIAGIF